MSEIKKQSYIFPYRSTESAKKKLQSHSWEQYQSHTSLLLRLVLPFNLTYTRSPQNEGVSSEGLARSG